MPDVEQTVVAGSACAVVQPRNGSTPPAPFVTWCDWARDGLAKALEAMKKTGEGVTEYHVGTRGLHRGGPADQLKNVDYWNQMVVFYCGDTGLPSSLTGRDTAMRIIPRDL
jgi:hypothetical protein